MKIFVVVIKVFEIKDGCDVGRGKNLRPTPTA